MIILTNKSLTIPIYRGTPLGNPYSWLENSKAKFKVKNRAEAISKYYTWIRYKIEKKDKLVCDELNKIYKLAKSGGVYLECFCAPNEDCHGEVIKNIVCEKLDENSLTYSEKKF